MTNYPTVDRESFQKLLASAFVMQQRQKDSQSRSAIFEVRRLITSSETDVDAAMHLIDRMQKLGNTPGDMAEEARLIDLNCAVERSNPPAKDELPGAIDSMEACLLALDGPTSRVKSAQFRSRDRWTPWLAILAIALAFLLGWMLGQVTVLRTSAPEGLPLRATAGRDAAPSQPELVRQVDPTPLTPTAAARNKLP